MRLIDAYALWSDIQMLPHNGDAISSEEVEQAIISAETIDPESLRPQGEWVKHSKIRGFVYCSNCRDVYIDSEWLADGKWTFCPNCGAKMRGSETE